MRVNYTDIRERGKTNSRGAWLDVHEEERKGRALAQAIISEGQNVVVKRNPDLLPSWYQHEKVTSGQEYFRNNVFSALLAMFHGLLLILAIPTILNVLVRTNKSSTPFSSYKRYMSTINHVISWFNSDLRNPNSKGRQSIREVKTKHSAVGTITQKDMALTQFAFMGFAVLVNDTLGFKGDKLDGYLHFWKVVGSLLGIEDKYNLCQGSVECTRVACEEIRKKVFCEWLENPPKKFREMAVHFVKGMTPVIIVLSSDSMIELTRRFCGLKPLAIPLVPTLILNYELFVLGLLQYRIFAATLLPILNGLMWFTLFVQKHAPILAYLSFKLDVRQMY